MAGLLRSGWMSFDPNVMLASMLVSSIGFVLFSYGRKQRRLPHALVGVVMLVYPYFVSDIPIMLGVVPALFGLLWLGTHMGM
jgi:hypothetical protein